MSLKVTTYVAVRRPTLIRVWRTTGQPGSPLISEWVPAFPASTRDMFQKGGRL